MDSLYCFDKFNCSAFLKSISMYEGISFFLVVEGVWIKIFDSFKEGEGLDKVEGLFAIIRLFFFL